MKPLLCVSCGFILAIGLCAAVPVAAQESALAARVAAATETHMTGSVGLGAARNVSSGVTDLKFREMFELPVGPRGLQPSQKMLGLDGQRVRMVGYMVEQETPRSLILAPLPLKLGDEDESLADDLPPSVVFIHFPLGENADLHHVPGLLELVGTLSIGGFPEADGRVSAVRLTLVPASSKEVGQHEFK
jgi:hypothetical protein